MKSVRLIGRSALGVAGLSCSLLAVAGLVVAILPRTPGSLAYCAILAFGRAYRFGALGLLGAGMGLMVRNLRPARIAVALGLGATVGFGALAAPTYVETRRRHLRRTSATTRFKVETVVFTSDTLLAGDLYRPSPRPRTPARAIVVVHGGAWRAGEKGEHRGFNEWFAARGYVVFDIEYRLAPAAKWREAVADIQAALRWLAAHANQLGADPGGTTLLGRSAGGHLALLAAYTAEPLVRPAAVVALYAPSDLDRLYREARGHAATELRAGLSALIGHCPANATEEYRLASPIHRVHPAATRTLLVHGSWDRPVPIDHSQRLASALRRSGVPVQLLPVYFARHAFDLVDGPASTLAREAILEFVSQP